MSYSFIISDYFKKSAKRLAKKYPSFKQDLQILKDSLQEDPLQGVELSPGIRKIRMAVKSKNKGKSGGLRVITYNVIAKEQDGEIVLLVLYDKEDASTAKLNVLKDIIKEMGFSEE